MGIYDINKIKDLIKDNSYVGRGITIGKSADGTKAAFAYFIMGRSENSRNRIFEVCGSDIKTRAFDESKLEDPSLIIYSAVKELDNKIIVTNGDQTDTIYDFINLICTNYYFFPHVLPVYRSWHSFINRSISAAS